MLLTPRQAAFVREYIVDFNGAAAYIRAGYSARGAAQSAAALLTNPNIQAAIKAHTDAATSANIMEYAEACEILTSMARGNLGAYTTPGGGIDLDAVRTHCPAAVVAVDATDGPDGTRITKIRLCDRVRVLERLAKLRGWDGPTKVAPTTPDGAQPYQAAMTPDEAVATYMEAIKRAAAPDA